MKKTNKKRLVIGMSGASGASLGIQMLEILKENPELESHLVISKGAEETIKQETEYRVSDVMELADKVNSIKDIGASIAKWYFQNRRYGNRSL